MDFRAFIILSLSLLPLLSEAQYHDPALDAVNVNLGYLNADTSGALGEVDNSIDTGFSTLSNLVKGLPSEMNTVLSSNANSRTTNLLGSFSTSQGVTPSQSQTFYEGAATNHASEYISGPVSNLLGGYRGLFSFPTNAAMLDGDKGINESDREFSLPKLGGAGFFTLSFNFDDIDSSFPQLASFRSLIRGLIIGIFTIMLGTMMVSRLHTEVGATLNQRQIQGTHITVFGWEISGITAAVYALIAGGIFLAIIAAISTMQVHTTVTNYTTDLYGYFSDLSVLPFFDYLTSFIPLGFLIQLGFQFLLFYYVLIPTAFLFLRAVLFFMLV